MYLLPPASAAVAISHGCCLPQALGDSLDERPTHSDVQAALSAASKSAVEPLQQQLAGLTAELDAVKARLRGAGQDLLHLKDWQVGLPCWRCCSGMGQCHAGVVRVVLCLQLAGWQRCHLDRHA